MADGFRATIQLKCWKQHECAGCGCEYRYQFQRTVSGEGGTEESAGKAAEAAAIAAMEGEVDDRPCPKCGLLQPDMIGVAKFARHWLVTLTSAAAVAVLLVMAGLPSADWMPYSFAASILGVIGVITVLIQAVVAFGDPNRNTDDNLARAQAMVARGEMEEVYKGGMADGMPKPVAKGARAILGVLAVGVLLMAAPFLLKTVSGWPSNPTKPDVISPGDTVRVYFPTSIDAVDGKWNGSPTVTVTDDGGAGPIAVAASSNSNSWGAGMNVKQGDEHTSPTIWADLTFPANDQLVGKTIKVTVDMRVLYPKAQGTQTFDDATTNTKLSAAFGFAPKGAADTYFLSYWASVLGGVVLLVGGILLASRASALRTLAPPTKVTPIRNEPPPRRSPPPNDDDEDDADDWRK